MSKQQLSSPRDIVRCSHCGERFEAGKYQEHVRASDKQIHDKHRAMHVDIRGNVFIEQRPSCEGSVGPAAPRKRGAASGRSD